MTYFGMIFRVGASTRDPSVAYPAAAAYMGAMATYRTVQDLAAAGAIPPGGAAALKEVARRYAVAVTPELAALIDPTDPQDPIRLQFIPDPRELIETPGESADPIGDEKFSPVLTGNHTGRVPFVFHSVSLPIQGIKQVWGEPLRIDTIFDQAFPKNETGHDQD